MQLKSVDYGRECVSISNLLSIRDYWQGLRPIHQFHTLQKEHSKSRTAGENQDKAIE